MFDTSYLSMHSLLLLHMRSDHTLKDGFLGILAKKQTERLHCKFQMERCHAAKQPTNKLEHITEQRKGHDSAITTRTYIKPS